MTRRRNSNGSRIDLGVPFGSGEIEANPLFVN